MFEIHPSNWPIAVDAGDPRNEFHERALREAQAATEWHGWADGTVARRPALVARLRAVFGPAASGPAPEPCICPA
jgi:hypothetical protein